MLDFLRNILITYLYIDINNDFTLIVLAAFLIAGIIIIILRVITTLSYQSYYSLFLMSAKEIKTIKEIKETTSKLLNKVMREYIRAVERGVQNVSTRAIVDKHICRLRLLFFRYRGIETFVTQFEISLVLIGILLAAFMDYSSVFAVSAIAMFCLMRIFALIFNFGAVRESLENEITVYVEREVGQHYATGVSTAIQMLKLEMKAIVQGQSKAIGDSIAKLCADLPEAMRIAAPVSQWGETVSEAKKLQEILNQSLNEINEAAASLSGAAGTLGKTMTAQNDYMILYRESVQAEINELANISEKLEPNALSLKSSLNYLEQNQKLLEKSIQSYELVLENITEKIGQGLGSIMSYNVETAYNKLNDNIIGNINKIILSNNEFYIRLQKLFEEMSEQSRNETQAIIGLKEQMDIHFEDLKERK